MNISLEAVADAVAALEPFTGRDVVALSANELKAASEAAAVLVRAAEIPGALLAGEIQRRSKPEDGGGMARRFGHRNATGMIADASGGSRGQANDLIAAGGLLGDDAGAGTPRFALVAEAFTSGELSSAKAALLRRTLEGVEEPDAEFEARLVKTARRLNLDDLKKACQQAVALRDSARWEAREKRMRDERFLQLSQSADGMVAVNGKLDPASAAVIKTYVDAQVRTHFQRRRAEGLDSSDPGEAGRARVDAWVDLCQHGMRCDQPGTGTSTEVVIRIDEQALRTGVGIGSCDAIGMPLSAGTLRRMAVDAKVLPVVLDGKSHVLDLGYTERLFTRAQRMALAERDGGCAFCHAPVSWTAAHHMRWWERDHGPTDLANGVLLCTRCHHRIHDDGWDVTATATEVWFTPPPDVDPEQKPRIGGKAALAIPD